MENELNDKIEYWIEIAAYDIATAKALVETKRFLYVGFMCHQAIEKILKAIYTQRLQGEAPPYTHNLLKLAKVTDIFMSMDEGQKEIMRILEPLNIDSRYPRVKAALNSSLTLERCQTIIQQTEGLFQWIKQQLLT
jgi:HEPN domain-containing protein